MMPYQPAFHHFTGFHDVRNEACFTGSYYRRILNERRLFLDMVFDACAEADLRLNVFDRNHDRLSRYFEFRFPKKRLLHLHRKVPHRETAQLYKSHAASINVNSVTGSETMCSSALAGNPGLRRYRRVQPQPVDRPIFSRLLPCGNDARRGARAICPPSSRAFTG